MKIRSGFVSNSSSSSFVLDVTKITSEQLLKVLNPPYETSEDDDGNILVHDAWNMELDTSGKKVIGYTSMDNFYMPTYFKEIGIPDEAVDWEGNAEEIGL